MEKVKRGRPKKSVKKSDRPYEVKMAVDVDENGDAIRKSFYSRISVEDARRKGVEYAEKLKAEKQGGYINKDAITLEQWANKWLITYKKDNVDENTYKFTYLNQVENHIVPFFKNRLLKDITNYDIQTLANEKSYLSNSMLGKIRLCINAIFETAYDNELIERNPTKNIVYRSYATPYDKHVYTEEQIKYVINETWDTLPDIALILMSGMRRGEALGLKWEDIDFMRETIHVQRSIALKEDKERKDIKRLVENPPKWDSYRYIPMSPKCKILLKELFEKSTRKTGYVFPLENGMPQTPNTWSQKLERHLTALKQDNPSLPRLTAHELRHTYGTHLRRNKVDIYSIQKILGHKDIRMTTEKYVHNEIEELKKAISKIDEKEYDKQYDKKKLCKMK